MPETPLLDALLTRVRAACDRSDRTQAQIAIELGLPPSRLNEYLPPTRLYKPNGEVTLALLRWVEKEEKRTKKPNSQKP